MGCFHPIQVWKYNFGPNRGETTLVRPWPAECDVAGVNYWLVPCGKCIGCRMTRARYWALRLEHERMEHELAYFLTLTYDPRYLPSNGLRHDDVQRFLKRYRALISPDQIRYFLCGEYGGQTYRPHYHAIIFGHLWPDVEPIGHGSNGDRLYTSKMCQSVWQLGNVVIGEASPRSMGYVARYAAKVYEDDDWQPPEGWRKPYIVMSRRPGIGYKAFERFLDSWKSDCIINSSKSKFSLPRYYLEKIKLTDEELYDTIKAKRLVNALTRPFADPDRLVAQEQYKLIKGKKLERNL